MVALDDPALAAHAWTRYRRLLAASGIAALGIGLAVALWLDASFGPLNWVGVAATVGGVGGSILLGGALMGLVFLSSGTGHDEAVDKLD